MTGTDSGKAYTNASATGSITVNLPSATAGRVFQFLVVTAQTMVIHPTSVDSIRGTGAGVSKTLAGTPGTLLYLECIVAGTWEILNSGGGGSGTVTSVAITGTDGSVIVNSGSPITGSGTIDLSTAPSISKFNLNADSHALLPTGVGIGPNDEFDFGSSIDTAGSRYASSTPWTAFNLGTGSTVVTTGALVFTPQVGAGVNYSGYTQPVPAATSYSYVTKVATSGAAGATLVGLLIGTASGTAGKLYLFGLNGTTTLVAQRGTNSTTFSSNAATSSYSGVAGVSTDYIYLQFAWNNGTSNLTLSMSKSGIPGSFTTLLSESSATFLGTPTLIGIGAQNQGSNNTLAIVDWFRRTA